MVNDNIPASRHHGAPKHGDALLASLLRCRRCGRKLTIRYTGANHDIPRYSYWRRLLDNGDAMARSGIGRKTTPPGLPAPASAWLYQQHHLLRGGDLKNHTVLDDIRWHRAVIQTKA